MAGMRNDSAPKMRSARKESARPMSALRWSSETSQFSVNIVTNIAVSTNPSPFVSNESSEPKRAPTVAPPNQ
ncbi:hypothetical protein [Mitsuokella sp. oral taxon 131]|uniref:hypothetical protein n=1 Tax=Mitsuokella sp. oral taxon 131 TaxID=1321780 RepID=UPI0026D107D8